jgi:hypothetical protein
MPKKEEQKKEQEELSISDQQVALVKLSILASNLSGLFAELAKTQDTKEFKSLQEKIDNVMNQMDNIIIEELSGEDLTKVRD